MARPSKDITALREELHAEGSYFCQKCDRVRPLGDFGKNKNNKHGIYTVCKDCTNARSYKRIAEFKEAHGEEAWKEKRREQLAKWRTQTKPKRSGHFSERLRSYNLKRKYGITEDEFNRMLAHQDGRCAICMTPKPPKEWHVDHCHISGEIRGILCNLCNGGLGFFQDNRESLLAAEIYLRGRI